MRPLILAARWLRPSPERWIEGGGLLIHGGRVARVAASPAALRRLARGARRLDLGEVVIAPGFVNAHAHLELSALAGTLPRGGDFAAWIRRLLELRAARSASELEAGARAGATRCLETGTTCVGDVDSTGVAERGLARHPLRRVHFREVLDAQDRSRTAAASRRIARALPRTERRIEGLAAHAPFSVSPELLAVVARLGQARRAPLSVHWSETREELEWLRDGSGPLARLLGPSPRRSGLDLLEEAGLLRAPLALVHGNLPQRGEPARIALAGAVVVHCPGSHAWFERAPFPLESYRRAGVPVALGTDSLASNEDLDLGREMRLSMECFPGLGPLTAWAMATESGAKALGLEGRAGSLEVGSWADLAVHRCDATALRGRIEELAWGASRVESTWVGGRLAAGEIP